MTSVIGVDLGGTKLSLTRYNLDSWEAEESILKETHAETTLPHIIEELIEAIQSLKSDNTTAVGIGVPGLVRESDNTIVTLPNIPGSQDISIVETISDAVGLPVTLDNDANCFALAEATLGDGKNLPVVIGITMGTGVGAGIVINGTLFRGHNGFAAEVGHMLLQPGNPPYKSDNKRGEVEQFFSGTAMGKRCTQAKSPEDYLEGEVCSFLQPQLFTEISWLIVNLTHLLDPSMILFGGSAGTALKPHVTDILTEAENWILPNTPLPAIGFESLDNSSTLGAALLTQSGKGS